MIPANASICSHHLDGAKMYKMQTKYGAILLSVATVFSVSSICVALHYGGVRMNSREGWILLSKGLQRQAAASNATVSEQPEMDIIYSTGPDVLPTKPGEICLPDASSIPRGILHTWKSTKDIPKNMAYWLDTWKLHNPKYEHTLWDDVDNRKFMVENYPWFLQHYDSYTENIHRADVIRYFYLYHNGGIYADMDFECLKEFDSLLKLGEKYDIILGKMGHGPRHDNDIPNAIMISKPRQPFWLFVFHALIETEPNQSVEQTTGPVMLKQAFEQYKQYVENTTEMKSVSWFTELANNMTNKIKPVCSQSRIAIMGPDVFYPVDWKNDGHILQYRIKEGVILHALEVPKLFPNSYAVTYWTHSWG